MTQSFVLRLVPTSVDDFAGEVEAVLSGERTVVRTADDLLAYLRTALVAGDLVPPAVPMLRPTMRLEPGLE